MKTILVAGGAGFIGHHLAKRLKDQGNKIIVVDIIDHNYASAQSYCNDFLKLDLSKRSSWTEIFNKYSDEIDVIYQLAADMGGAGFVFTGEHDYDIMHNSALINLHCVEFALRWGAKVFYSSSACMYPAYNQEDPLNPKCSEDSAYPANPDSEYGWEKLFSERLYLNANKNYKLDVRIARFHNIFGPEGTYTGGREKAPAALCRKVIEAEDHIDVWGPGIQTRSFLYIDECIEGIERLMKSEFIGPVNLGSEEMISINNLAKMVIDIAGKNIAIRNIPGPLGVMGRNSDNALLYSKLGWKPSLPLRSGMEKTYTWIYNQIKKA